MKFSKSIIELIKTRTSWRTYADEILSEENKVKIKAILEHPDIKSPFDGLGGKSTFKLVEMSEFSENEKKNLGLSKILSGSYDFIVGHMNEGEFNRENYGYYLEMVILKMTDLGLGTCWLASYFNRKIVPLKIGSSSENMPAIATVGNPIQRSPIGLKIRKNIKADERLPWKILFYEGDTTILLERRNLDMRIAESLEMLRLSPSAKNRQPWRVIKGKNGNKFHFYTTYRGRWRHLDLGIAVAHFDQTTHELNLKGKWICENPEIENTLDLLYVISWIEN